MNSKTLKMQRNLKQKLMAAISMLLVSSLMLVTSTYAWFTLSTAPEVTGITTAVGANGNLEMALLPAAGDVNLIKSEVGDSIKAVAERNITWGNLVDLSDTDIYGMDKITLYPAELNDATWDEQGNPVTLAEALLSTPTFGADGRIDKLMPNTVTSTFDSTAMNFPQNEEYGVRAVGVASGMTDRQLAYRNARSAANTAMSTAITKASQSLSGNGSSLANVALKKATNDNPTFNDTDVASLQKIVSDLVGTVVWNEDGSTVKSISKSSALGQIEQAYINYMYAYTISQAGIDDDELQFSAVKAIFEAENATLDSVMEAAAQYISPIPESISIPVNKLNATILKVATAQKELAALSGNDYSWTQISTPLYKLANTDKMLIAGYEASEVKENMSAIVSSVANGGLTITIASEGGVYADIADHCGNYDASVTIAEVSYGGVTLNNMTASMTTQTNVSPVYLTALGAVVLAAGAPESATGAAMPITDMYGYIVDLAFRTNAAESNLLLQQDGVDRIYDENGNEETMGHGSTMTFKATTTAFSDEQVKSLMNAIRIVFFQKGNENKVLATAKLDTANAELGVDGWTAKMYLYTVTAGGETVYEAATYADDSNVTYYVQVPGVPTYSKIEGAPTDGTQVYVLSGEGTYTSAEYDADSGLDYYVQVPAEPSYSAITDGTAGEKAAAGTPLYIQKTTSAGENVKADNVITALTQNEATQVSVLVYLDGNHVGNKDVAATAPTSVSGTMNLQFASSATLVPMDYADLHIPVANGTQQGTEQPTQP